MTAAAQTPSSTATILPFAEHSKAARDTRPLRLITCGSVAEAHGLPFQSAAGVLEHLS